MEIGDQKTVVIPADQAYGLYDEELVLSMDRNRISSDLDLEVDDRLQVRRKSGEILNVTVTEMSESTVILDGNHPLAGKSLKVHVTIHDVRTPTRQEIAEDGTSCSLPGTLH